MGFLVAGGCFCSASALAPWLGFTALFSRKTTVLPLCSRGGAEVHHTNADAHALALPILISMLWFGVCSWPTYGKSVGGVFFDQVVIGVMHIK